MWLHIQSAWLALLHFLEFNTKSLKEDPHWKVEMLPTDCKEHLACLCGALELTYDVLRSGNWQGLLWKLLTEIYFWTEK